MSGPIGVLGGSGTVGAVVVDRLARWGIGPLRVGGRDLRRASEACARATVDTEPVSVDLTDPTSLAEFCAGCSMVANCAGPSYQVLDTVARAALSADAQYVDAAGDVVALRALRTDPPSALDRHAAVFSAGLMPGLSGLLPRLFADGEPLARLDIYVGGAVPIGELSAVDALLTRGPDFGTALAAWRDGAVVEHALPPLRSVLLPGFRDRVHAWPFLSVEAAHLASVLGVDELRNYTVYVTENLPAALAEAWADDPARVYEHIPAVMRAAEQDVAVTGRYYAMLFDARPPAGLGRRRRLLLETKDSYQLSGVVLALTVADVLAGRVPAGAHVAADVLDARHVLDRLAGDPLVTNVELA